MSSIPCDVIYSLIDFHLLGLLQIFKPTSEVECLSVDIIKFTITHHLKLFGQSVIYLFEKEAK